MTVEQPYIFISHSSKDNTFTGDLADGLREAGFNVWVDLDSIPDGGRWLREIQQGVEGCGALLMIMSRFARESEWVERETLLALTLRKPLYIAQIDDAPLPLHLIDRQFTDFREDESRALKQIIRALRKISLADTPPPEKHALPAKISPTPNEDNFFKYLEQLPDGDQHALIARDLYRWAQETTDSVIFGGKYTPGFHARVDLDAEVVTVFSLWAYMRSPAAQVPFQYLLKHAPYDDADLRRSTLRSLNRLMPEGDKFDSDRADRRPNLPLLSALDRAEHLELFKQVMAEIVDNLRSV
jgi:hypothetical protein